MASTPTPVATAPAAPSQPLTERPGAGLAVSLAIHGLLLAALAWGVSWSSPAPVQVSAELWAATPQQAAPRVDTPPAENPVPQPAEPAPAALSRARRHTAP